MISHCKVIIYGKFWFNPNIKKDKLSCEKRQHMSKKTYKTMMYSHHKVYLLKYGSAVKIHIKNHDV